MHEDTHNIDKQGEVSHLQCKIDEIETCKARGAAIRARVKWQLFGDKRSTEFFKSVCQKHSQTVISALRDSHGRIFTKKEDLDKIGHDFYKDLCKHREVSEDAIRQVFEGFSATFTQAMNDNLMKEITG